MVSHELRTPLQCVIGYTGDAIRDLTLLENNTDSVVADLKVALQAATKLVSLIDNLLDFSRIEAGRMTVDWSDVDIRSLIEDGLQIVTPLAKLGRNQILFNYNCPSDRYFTDRQKLLQILLNLLSNACKFSQGGTITVKISCPGDILIMSVSDTGQGIPKSDQAIIFDAFRQSRSQASHPGGTGLGLAVTSRLCALLGGTIDVQSEVGSGATFTVRLPIRRAIEETTLPTQSEP
jgi:signal transduction histidine kinase